MNMSGYIAVNSWGYDVAKTSQAASTNKSFTIPIEELASEKQTQKNLNNAKINPFETGSFNFKDWCANKDPLFDPNMYTKTEPTRSDEEILKDMAELGKKQAQRGVFQEQDEEFLALMKEYMSSVSPDREGILNRAMNEIIGRTKQGEDYTMSDIYQKMQSQIATQKYEDDKVEKEKNKLLDYFLKLIESKENTKSGSGIISSITGNGDCYTVTVDNGGGMTTTLGYVNGEFTGMSMGGNNYSDVQLENYGTVGAVDNAMFRDDNGNVIATYSPYRGADGKGPGGFHSIPTGAEMERRVEIVGAYNAGYDFTTGRYLPQSSEYNDTYSNLSRDAYNKTYDILRSSAYA